MPPGEQCFCSRGCDHTPAVKQTGELRFYIDLKASSSPQRYFVRPVWRFYFHFPWLPSLKNWEKTNKQKKWDDSHMTRSWGYSRRSGRSSSTAWKRVGWLVRVRVLTLCTKSLPPFCDPMDYSLPGSSVRGILQATRVDCHPFSRGSSWPRDWTWASYVSCIGRWALYHQVYLGACPGLTRLSLVPVAGFRMNLSRAFSFLSLAAEWGGILFGPESPEWPLDIRWPWPGGY